MAEKGGARPGSGGKRAGAGRPKKIISDIRRRWQEKWLTEWVTDEDMQYLCQMTVGLAKRGDAGARADVFKYLLGNPPQSVEVSGPDGGPIARVTILDQRNDALPAPDSLAATWGSGRPLPAIGPGDSVVRSGRDGQNERVP